MSRVVATPSLGARGEMPLVPVSPAIALDSRRHAAALPGTWYTYQLSSHAQQRVTERLGAMPLDRLLHIVSAKLGVVRSYKMVYPHATPARLLLCDASYRADEIRYFLFINPGDMRPYVAIVDHDDVAKVRVIVTVVPLESAVPSHNPGHFLSKAFWQPGILRTAARRSLAEADFERFLQAHPALQLGAVKVEPQYSVRIYVRTAHGLREMGIFRCPLQYADELRENGSGAVSHVKGFFSWFGDRLAAFGIDVESVESIRAASSAFGEGELVV